MSLQITRFCWGTDAMLTKTTKASIQIEMHISVHISSSLSLKIVKEHLHLHLDGDAKTRYMTSEPKLLEPNNSYILIQLLM